MFSQSIAQILLFCDNSYINRCGFSMPTKQFYFKRKRVETGNDILQILKMVENPSNLPHLEKNSFRALQGVRIFLAGGQFRSFENKKIELQQLAELRARNEFFSKCGEFDKFSTI